MNAFKSETFKWVFLFSVGFASGIWIYHWIQNVQFITEIAVFVLVLWQIFIYRDKVKNFNIIDIGAQIEEAESDHVPPWKDILLLDLIAGIKDWFLKNAPDLWNLCSIVVSGYGAVMVAFSVSPYTGGISFGDTPPAVVDEKSFTFGIGLVVLGFIMQAIPIVLKLILRPIISKGVLVLKEFIRSR